MKKNGFSLIEMLGVIVILAILFLIIMPIINWVTETTKMNAFKDSVYGLMESAQMYRTKNILDTIPEEGFTFYCDGKSCQTKDGKILEFKGEIPISGSITLTNRADEIASFVSNGKYCADGPHKDLKIAKNCYELDQTPPIVDETKVITSSSTNSITITIPSDIAKDEESGIKKYIITINGETKEVDFKEDTIEITFDNLEPGKEYEVTIEIVNNNNLKTEIKDIVSTLNFENPKITLTNSPTTPVNGYLKSQIASVTFSNKNIKTPTYYIKTTRIGISNLNVTEVCGNETTPQNCKKIENITTLNPNLWYKVTGNINITYNKASEELSTILAITYDGHNYSGATSATISKIREEAPYKVNHYIMNASGSGYTLNESQSLVGKANTSVTPSVKTYTGFNSPATQTVNINLDGSTVVNYYYTRKTYTIYFNANGGSVSQGSKSVLYGNTYGTLPTPYRADTKIPDQALGTSQQTGVSATTRYVFTGWFTSPSGGSQITASTGVSASPTTTLYAHWGAQTPSGTIWFGNASLGAYNSAVLTIYTYGYNYISLSGTGSGITPYMNGVARSLNTRYYIGGSSSVTIQAVSNSTATKTMTWTLSN